MGEGRTAGPLLIDLGEDRAPPELDRAPDPPGRRWLAVVATVLAVLVLVTGSALPAAVLSEVRLDASLGDSVALAGNRLYVIRPDVASLAADLGPRTITAYQLPSGRQLWRRSLPVTGKVRQTIPAPGALLIAVEQDTTVETVAVDSNSGQVRWRRPYQPIGPSPSGRLVLTFAVAQALGSAAQGVLALRLDTGEPAWSYPVPADSWHDLDFGGDYSGATVPAARAVIAAPSGRVVVRDLETGQVVGSAELGPSPAGGRRFELAGDLLLVAGLAAGPGTISAYGVPGLDRRWSIAGSLAGGYVSADCAAALCFFARSGGLRVLDPDTGRTRWADLRWEAAETFGRDLLAHAWRPLDSGSVTAVLDPATGRALLDLGRWTVLWPVDGNGTVPAVRIDPASGRAWFAIMDVPALSVRVLGSVPGVSGDCQATAGVLVCRRLDASLGVWRYRDDRSGQGG